MTAFLSGERKHTDESMLREYDRLADQGCFVDGGVVDGGVVDKQQQVWTAVKDFYMSQFLRARALTLAPEGVTLPDFSTRTPGAAAPAESPGSEAKPVAEYFIEKNKVQVNPKNGRVSLKFDDHEAFLFHDFKQLNNKKRVADFRISSFRNEELYAIARGQAFMQFDEKKKLVVLRYGLQKNLKYANCFLFKSRVFKVSDDFRCCCRLSDSEQKEAGLLYSMLDTQAQKHLELENTLGKSMMTRHYIAEGVWQWLWNLVDRSSNNVTKEKRKARDGLVGGLMKVRFSMDRVSHKFTAINSVIEAALKIAKNARETLCGFWKTFKEGAFETVCADIKKDMEKMPGLSSSRSAGDLEAAERRDLVRPRSSTFSG